MCIANIDGLIAATMDGSTENRKLTKLHSSSSDVTCTYPIPNGERFYTFYKDQQKLLDVVDMSLVHYDQ